MEFLESIHSRFRFVSLEGDDYFASIRESAANRIAGGAIHEALIVRCAASRVPSSSSRTAAIATADTRPSRWLLTEYFRLWRVPRSQ
jgi:hypothetical protein